MLEVTLPLRLVSEANRRDHWRVVRKRLGEHKSITHMRLAGIISTIRFLIESPEQALVKVTLTRIGLRRLDTDNLAGACKGVRDGVALALGVDDADPRITWVYEQRTGERRYAVSIRLEAT